MASRKWKQLEAHFNTISTETLERLKLTLTSSECIGSSQIYPISHLLGCMNLENSMILTGLHTESPKVNFND